MSEEYEKDDEDEYKQPVPPTLKPTSMPPPSMPPPPTMPPVTPTPTYEPEPVMTTGPSQTDYDAIYSQVQQKDGTISQLQAQIGDLNNQCAILNAQLLEKDNHINQLSSQIRSLQSTAEGYQNQITQLNNEKAQFQAMIPQLQNQVQQFQQENMSLQQQIGPLQSQINKLQEELTYKDRRIQELKEPKAVMPSSLAQGVTSQTPSYGSTPSYISPDVSQTPSPSTEFSGGLGSGRKICPNCGSTGFAIKEVEDKTKIISYIPKPQYAKKNVCTKCGFEF